MPTPKSITMGQLLVNEALPEDIRDYSRRLDKKGVKSLFKELALKHPDKYREVAAKLMDIGASVSHSEGSSISLKDLKTSKLKKQIIPKLQEEVERIAGDKRLSPADRDKAIIEATSKLLGVLDEGVYREGIESKNRLVDFAESGARGGKSNVNQLLGAGLIVSDNMGRPVPVPITHNYSEGIDPAEAWANSYGVRSGYVALKDATPKAGYLGKQLAQAAHKLIVSEDTPLEGTGLPVDTDDPDNEGAVLARDYGKYEAGTVLTPKIMKELKRKNKRILIHSPISSISTGRGIPRIAAGIREYGRFPLAGENIGIAASQSISEPLSQSSISAKHSAGVAGASGGGSSAETQAGFEIVNRMANIPKHYLGKATIANTDGTVSMISEAPQGGSYIHVNNDKYYVPPELSVDVKVGQTLEAGDALSTGLPSPAEVVKHKGIGEGRRYFLEKMRETLDNSNVKVNRRNIELIARSLINHIRVGDSGIKGSLPGDIVEYDEFAARYSPREGAKAVPLKMAKNKYLEHPILHYSVGTRVTPRTIKTLKDFGVNNIMVHDDAPDFEPEMQRAVDILGGDDDWQVRMGGFNLKKNLLESIHRSAKSDIHADSYIPALAKGTEFGKSKKGPY